MTRQNQSCGIQDPTCSTTWFSSWLWAVRHNGWPEKTETLKNFIRPTPRHRRRNYFLLGRAHDHGELRSWARCAFRDVYFTGIGPRQQEGRKMSKTLAIRPDRSTSSPNTRRRHPLRHDAQPPLARTCCSTKGRRAWPNFSTNLECLCFRQMQGGDVQGEINSHCSTTTPNGFW